MNDPRPSNSYNKVYTIQYLGNMVGGVPVKYINQDIAVLKRMAADSIKNNEVRRRSEVRGLVGRGLSRFGKVPILL